ncbi:hypothetical protein GGS20DRAFT_585352 [Poronia punctata]|nr:hypothetical protein GGS20DRAFT_585352 [Poronia punctata]
MALPRDFETPIAGFDVDLSRREVVVKLMGQSFTYNQNHTPPEEARIALSDFLVFAPQVVRDAQQPSARLITAATWPRRLWACLIEDGARRRFWSPGGSTYEPELQSLLYMPRGESYKLQKEAPTAELENVRMSKDSMVFL